MEIVIIVLLLASLFCAWILSVRRKLEIQEENIRNAGVDSRATERIIKSTEKYCRDLGNHASFAGTGDLSEILEGSKKL